MQLILLPGMDGTGLLFDQLLRHLKIPAQVLPLPVHIEQTYPALADYYAAQLPNQDCILLAESFSGPIAAMLLGRSIRQIKGVIFLASFIRTPRPWVVQTARWVPLKILLGLPGAAWAIRHFLIGPDYPLKLFYAAIAPISTQLIKARLYSLGQINQLHFSPSDVPVLHLQAQQDYCVSAELGAAFKTLYSNFTQRSLPGTHFLAQSNPRDCAAFIEEFVEQIMEASSCKNIEFGVTNVVTVQLI